jgi:hypothetical protein
MNMKKQIGLRRTNLALNNSILALFVLHAFLALCVKGQMSGGGGYGQSFSKYENMSIRYVSWVVREPEAAPEDLNRVKPYCSFFNNRQPTAQINLKNCTWYHENSCCLQSEIESTFSKVKTSQTSHTVLLILGFLREFTQFHAFTRKFA